MRLNRHGLGSFCLICIALILSACATGPKPQPLVSPTASPAPGSFLEADYLRTIPSSEEWLMLAAASPWLIGTRVTMDVLKKEGYAAWRASRIGALSDIRVMRISFSARLPEGGSERQSGTVFLPKARSEKRQELSWVIFAKGTELRREFTPSRNKGSELPFITALAALGYAIWVPDFTGMGDGLGTHEYCVAESLADSALDGLAAARQWLVAAATEGGGGYAESGRLAVIGYSEGGLAAMGTLKAIADNRISTPGLSLEAVYAMGAPLNLTILDSDLGEGPFPLSHPEYQVYLGLGWARVYPEDSRLGDIFLARTIDRIVPLYDGTRRDVDIKRQIATIVGKKTGSVTDEDIFSPEYLAALRRNPASSAYYRVQAAARLDNWAPPMGIPLILAATPSDDIVPFANSENEFEWAKEHAPQADVSFVRLASKGHINAGIEAYLYAIVDLDRREAKLKAAGSP